MLTKNEMTYYSSLLKKKYRKKEGKFLVEGEKLVEEALNSRFICEKVFTTTAFFEQSNSLVGKIKELHLPLEVLRIQDFEKLSDTQNTQGIAAAFLKAPEKTFTPGDRLVILDNISDPGNAGTIIRNCDWFGFNDIMISENSVELFNPKVLRSSMGSAFHLNIFECDNLGEVLSSLKEKEYKIFSTDLEGENIYSLSVPDKFVLLLSNEANGPSEEIERLADIKITIPRYGKAESLNVANASAVIFAEIARRINT